VTHAALSPLIGPEFDEFLCAPIGEDRAGTPLSVLSALARLDVDPWREATSLARMPRQAAVERLTALLDALPHEAADGVASKASAAALVALLPGRPIPNVAPEGGAVQAGGFRPGPMLLGVGAIVLMTLIVLAMSDRFPAGLGTGANPPPTHAAGAAMAPSTKTVP